MNEKRSSTPDFHVVIPARYGSSRLPGKPLEAIAGKPMIEHVALNAQGAGAKTVIVATDDQRIIHAVNAFGGRAMMTRNDHTSGTDRIAEVARKEEWRAGDIVVNLQGDEPTIAPELIRLVAIALHNNPTAGISTLAAPIQDMNAVRNSNVVKVTLANDGLALYFSRAPIPWNRDAYAHGIETVEEIPPGTSYLRHIGIYAYRVDALERISSAPKSDLEQSESLEQLRALSMGIRIHVTTVDNAPQHGVDTPEDLERINTLIQTAAGQ